MACDLKTTAHPLLGIATLVERLALARECQLEEEDERTLPISWLRRMQGEKASRMLLVQLMHLSAHDGASTGATLRSLIETLQTLIHASTPSSEPRVTLTTHYRYVEMSDAQGHMLILLALELVLQAYNDGALDIALTLDEDGSGVRLRCTSQHPSLGLAHAPIVTSDARRAKSPLLHAANGTMHVQQPAEDVIQVDVCVPARVERVLT